MKQNNLVYTHLYVASACVLLHWIMSRWKEGWKAGRPVALCVVAIVTYAV
jgi:hypothetical protein